MITPSIVPSLKNGLDTIMAHVRTLPSKPGVYRMIGARQKVLYVGKALNLKNRVTSYTKSQNQPRRLQRMISETISMEFVVTSSEVEALLLEANLIKRFDPPYNIRLKDDKFFSYIHLSEAPYPRLSKQRGRPHDKGDYFGPFVSINAIDHVILALQKSFKIRSCADSYFKGRTCPCLQYHIKRCSAPCIQKGVQKSAPKDAQETYNKEYDLNILNVKRVLNGKTQEVQHDLQEKMLAFSHKEKFEQAALLRDQIKALTSIQSHQNINLKNSDDADIFALESLGGQVCIQGFFYRNGSNYGTKSFFLKETSDISSSDVFQAFLLQFYENTCPPSHIISNISMTDSLTKKALIALRERLSQEGKNKTIHFHRPQRGEKLTILESVSKNAMEALERQNLTRKSAQENLENLTHILSFTTPIQRIEVYDNSHIQGSNAIGGMIVSGVDGFEKKHYRKFNIKSDTITPGDDFAMMKEVLKRRFKGSLSKDINKSPLPDLVIIDGGKGQMSAAQEIFEANDIKIPLLCIAKGVERNAGNETFFTKETPQGFKLNHNKSALYFLQRLRDEAHRFAITFHRTKRTKSMVKSILDGIPGVGAARKKALLHHFGTAQSVKAASQKDFEAIDGISKNLAKSIYSFIHSS